MKNKVKLELTTVAKIVKKNYCPCLPLLQKVHRATKTIRIQGLIQHTEVLILIDSSSSCTFVSEALVQSLKLPTVDIPATQVKMANGGLLRSTRKVNQLTWWAQGHTFSTEARVLALGCYDIILGIDWLEQHSPMWVHWKRKRMRFSHHGKRITLSGVKDNTTHCKKITVKKAQGPDQKERGSTNCPIGTT